MARDRFCIWIVDAQMPQYDYRIFLDVARPLSEAFAALGIDAPVVTRLEEVFGTPIVLGCNVLQRLDFPPQITPIIYNLEQVDPRSEWMHETYVGLMRRYPTWDYSPRNIEQLKTHYGVDAIMCGVGYMPSMTRIVHATEKDVDISFIGSFHPRRWDILQKLHDSGLEVVAGGDSFGERRDLLYARSKIAMNIHMFDAHVLEIVRVSLLLANKVCVVSESGADQGLEGPLAPGIAFAPYDKLVETCIALLKEQAERDRIAAEGFRIYSAMSLVDMLRRALAQTPS